ncbi:MAG: hypothetical protein JWM28_3092 [Chitinophagaceae bacterium]|nr:hypothetical protein [Chitinophagaceae bacterium]
MGSSMDGIGSANLMDFPLCTAKPTFPPLVSNFPTTTQTVPFYGLGKFRGTVLFYSVRFVVVKIRDTPAFEFFEAF